MSGLLRAILGLLTIVAVIFTLLTYAFVMDLALILIALTQLGGDLRSYASHPPIGVFYVYSKLIRFPIAVDLLTISSFCLLVFGTCFVAGLRSRDGFLHSLGKLTKAGRITSSSNWLVAMPLVSSSLLAVVVILSDLLSAAGVSSGTLCDPKINAMCPNPTQLFADLAYAPISEEVAFRIITPLGLVFPARVLWKKFTTRDRLPISRFLAILGLSVLSPESAKAKNGYPTFAKDGWRAIHWTEWVFIAGSSLLFGLAHVSGGGTNWGQGKVVTAAVSGIVLAIVYVIYGAFANVLLHWFFDFYVEVMTLGFPVSGGSTALLVNVIIFGGLLLIGTFSTIIAVAWLVRRIANRMRPTAYKPPEALADSIQ